MILPMTQQNLLFPQSSYSKYCHCRQCHANYSRTVPSFTMASRLLGAPALLNQMSFVGNFTFLESFAQYLKSMSAVESFRFVLANIHYWQINEYLSK